MQNLDPNNCDIRVEVTVNNCFNLYQLRHWSYRQNLDPNNYDIYVEMEFYSFLIERFIEWMYGAIKESNMASIWKILVAYQKIVTVMEHIGIERALGTVRYLNIPKHCNYTELLSKCCNAYVVTYALS